MSGQRITPPGGQCLQSLLRKDPVMIIFDLSFRHLSILAQRETVQHTFRINREGRGEVVIDLPYLSIAFTKHRKTGALLSR